jgi:hypothetical protein
VSTPAVDPAVDCSERLPRHWLCSSDPHPRPATRRASFMRSNRAGRACPHGLRIYRAEEARVPARDVAESSSDDWMAVTGRFTLQEQRGSSFGRKWVPARCVAWCAVKWPAGGAFRTLGAASRPQLGVWYAARADRHQRDSAVAGRSQEGMAGSLALADTTGNTPGKGGGTTIRWDPGGAMTLRWPLLLPHSQPNVRARHAVTHSLGDFGR